MARIHGRRADRSWIEGVEVCRQLYTAIGIGWLVAVTRGPGVSHLCRLGYHMFAENRLRLTGWCAPDGSCKIPAGVGGPQARAPLTEA